MILKTRYKFQKDIKKHIDYSLFRRKVQSRLKRRLRNAYKEMNHVVHKDMQPVIGKEQGKKTDASIPLFVSLEYDSVFDNRENINPKDFLADVPILRAIEFIVSLQNRVLYAFSDIDTQQKIIDEMRMLFHGDEGSRIDNFVTNQKQNQRYPYIMDNNSCFLFYMLALQHFNKVDRTLTDEDKRNIFKAYLYSAHIWLEKQQENIEGLNKIDLSIRVDIPIIEFKSYKDYKPQLYKAARFFLFCKSNPKFEEFSKWFFKDKDVKDASEYLLKIFSLYSSTIKEPATYIQFKEPQNPDIYFFDQYTIDIADCEKLWTNRDLGYLRTHFLLKESNPVSGKVKYLLLNAMLLVDKLYQGMIFDFADSVIKRHGTNDKGVELKNMADFNGFLGEVFSEKHILYDTMELAFPSNNYLKLKGEDLKANMIGEPDYCLLHDNSMFLFEFKDNTLGNHIKQSTDVNYIKKEILDRICKWDKKKKGVGQLIYNIDRIFNEQLLEKNGIDASTIKNVFPIVVTTDSAFSALGISELIKQEFIRLMQEHKFDTKDAIIWTPVILDFDTLFNLVIPFRESNIRIENLLKDYIVKCSNHKYSMLPFNSFIKDYINLPNLKKEDISIIYGGLLNLMKTEVDGNL